MKLLYCDECGDVFNLGEQLKICSCGKTKGMYEADGLHAWFYSEGIAVPFGIDNASFRSAAQAQAIGDKQMVRLVLGKRFTAFIIPIPCDTMTRKEQ